MGMSPRYQRESLLNEPLSISYLIPTLKAPSPKGKVYFLTNYTMAINQNDYHYWKGSFQGFLPNEILKLSDEDFQTLYEEFEEKGLETHYLEHLIEDEKENEENEDYPYIEGKVLKQVFKDFLYEIDSDYFKHSTIKEINLFRSISVDEIEEIDFNDKGICWTYYANNICYIEEILVPDNKYLVRFYGTTPIDNIDWIESFFLYINYGTQEKELRVYDSQKVFLKGYVNINYSNMMEYSRNGETSYLLDGVITKESILKRRESLLKELKLNPQTNRYDYDGELKSSDLKFFVSDNYDGFIINFGKVTGDFNCSYNNLTSLKGAPQNVGGSFRCYNNQLTSLEGAPQKVGGGFNCHANKLISLEGAPQKVGGDFDCNSNQLTSLKGAPTEVGWDFNCQNNQITSLEGAPQRIGESFNCSDNQLTSLEGAPNTIGRNLDCRNNPNLHSLEGIGEVKGKIYKDF